MTTEQPSPELRAALDASTVPAARPEFKAELAKRFLSGQFAADGIEDVDLAEGLDSWSVPPARPEFREALRAEFLAGQVAAPSRAKGEQAPVYSIYRYLAAALTAAALVLFWFAPWESGAAGAWQAVGLDVTATTPVVHIDGKPVSVDDDRALDHAFSQGCRLETESEALIVMRVEQGVLMEIAEATRVDIARSVAKDDTLGLSFSIESGALRISTRPEFAGSIKVVTPDARIDLSGRSVGVDVLESGTCLCILNGEARMSAVDGSGDIRVLSNSTAFIYRDGSESVLMEGEVHHSEPLHAVRDAGETFLY